MQPFASHPVGYLLAAVLGLVIGSFLNVVISRVPRMLEQEWAAACAEANGQPVAATPAFHLAWPPSHCPHCESRLHWYELVPVLSWLWRRGRCGHCQAPIAWQYPLVELATAALFAASLARFGDSPLALGAVILGSFLIALAVIDARTSLLPDNLTQPLLWTGLVFTAVTGTLPYTEALFGAVAGYLVLWLVATGFHRLTGREGMGQGDWKLAAALGAWLGWPALPSLLLVSAVAGILSALLLRLLGRLQAGEPLPFGPYLAGAGLLLYFLPPLA